MKIQIKSMLGSVLFEGDFSSLAEAVTAAVKSSADLRYADLRYADLRSADLRYADLRYADLRYANLSSADLRSADLRSTDLSYADLRYADLRSANLRYADLSYADLRYADLRSANLRYANLSYADLRYAENCEMAVAVTRVVCEGSIIGWKKSREGAVVKLRIPEAAKRSNAWGRKCRAEYAEVLDITLNGKPLDRASSYYDDDGKTSYTVGATVHCDKWEEDFSVECGGGIHFFITRAEAEAYFP